MVELAPGDRLDTLARNTGQKMTDTWGQPVVMENRPGATTVISTSLIANAAPEEFDRILRRQIKSLSKVARDAGVIAK